MSPECKPGNHNLQELRKFEGKKQRKVAVAFLEGSRKSVGIPSWLLLKKTAPKKQFLPQFKGRGEAGGEKLKPVNKIY